MQFKGPSQIKGQIWVEKEKRTGNRNLAINQQKKEIISIR